MSGIQRFDQAHWGMTMDDEHGDYVLYGDHKRKVDGLEAEIARLRAEIDALLEVIAPSAHFALVRAALGGTSPKSGTVYSVFTSSCEAEITAEDFEAAFNAIARSACTEIHSAMGADA